MCQEGKIYFSGKLKQNCLKVEVSVLPNGIAAHCLAHFPDSTADVTIMNKNLCAHKKLSKKAPQ